MLRGRNRPVWSARTHNIDHRYRLRKTKTESRIITVPILIMHNGFSDLQRKKEDLAQWLVHDKPKMLEFTDDPNRHYMALVNNEMIHEESYHWAEGEIEFICPMPFKLGGIQTINLSMQNKTFTIKGQTETPWKSKTVFTIPQSQYVLESNKGKVILNYEFIPGDVLEIDYKLRSIKLNGVNMDVGLSLESIWFDLDAGEMQLKASHETELTYRERYY